MIYNKQTWTARFTGAAAGLNRQSSLWDLGATAEKPVPFTIARLFWWYWRVSRQPRGRSDISLATMIIPGFWHNSFKCFEGGREEVRWLLIEGPVLAVGSVAGVSSRRLGIDGGVQTIIGCDPGTSVVLVDLGWRSRRIARSTYLGYNCQ